MGETLFSTSESKPFSEPPCSSPGKASYISSPNVSPLPTALKSITIILKKHFKIQYKQLRVHSSFFFSGILDFHRLTQNVIFEDFRL